MSVRIIAASFLVLVCAACGNRSSGSDAGAPVEDAGSDAGVRIVGGDGGTGVDAGLVIELASDPLHSFTAITHDATRVYVGRTGADGGAEIATIDLSGGSLTAMHDAQADSVAGMLYANGDLFYVSVLPNEFRRLPLDGGAETVLASFVRAYPQLVASGDSIYVIGVGGNYISVDRMLRSADAGSGFSANSSFQNGLTTIAGFGVSGSQEVYGLVGDPNVYVAANTGFGVVPNAIASDAGELTGLSVYGNDAYVARSYGPVPQLGRIEKVPLDGTDASTIAELSLSTRYILTDGQHLFWAEYDGTEHIYRANLDGSDKTQLGALTTTTYLYDQTPNELLLITRESAGGKLFAVPK